MDIKNFVDCIFKGLIVNTLSIQYAIFGEYAYNYTNKFDRKTRNIFFRKFDQRLIRFFYLIACHILFVIHKNGSIKSVVLIRENWFGIKHKIY